MVKTRKVRCAAWNQLPLPEGAGRKESACPFSLAPCPVSASSGNHPTAEDVPSCNELHFRCRVGLWSWKRGSFDAPPFAPSWENKPRTLELRKAKDYSVSRSLVSHRNEKKNGDKQVDGHRFPKLQNIYTRSGPSQIGQTLENRIKASCRSCSRFSSLRCFSASLALSCWASRSSFLSESIVT